MRIAIISDIHGNLTALEAVAADLELVSPDLVVLGGDLVANGPRPAEVIDFLRDREWTGVVGNTDVMLWRPELLQELHDRAPSRGGLRTILFKDIAPFTAAAIGQDRLQWLQSLPGVWRAEGLCVLHASPGDLWRAPLANASDAELREVYGPLETPCAVYGHIHNPFVRPVGDMIVANTGSVSLSYDGDPRASYAVFDAGQLTIRRVDYDRAAAVEQLRTMAYPHAGWISTVMVTGHYLPPDTSA